MYRYLLAGLGMLLLWLLPVASPLTITPHSTTASPKQLTIPPVLSGDWAKAKVALQSPDCCVVSVLGLESHLQVLQAKWAESPSNVDLRARVRTSTHAHDDCLQVKRTLGLLLRDPRDEDHDDDEPDPCTAALVELTRGVASLADGPLEGVCTDVFLRIVGASDYRARDPMFHTDKAPLRGYVTLRGSGTEFMARPSSPLEYASLRSLGSLPVGASSPKETLRLAHELEFIVMKGDHYEPSQTGTYAKTAPWLQALWKRASACVHRSPPALLTGGRRVILSLDLADGEDDREWYEANKKREWRSGMTQRKSHLVA